MDIELTREESHNLAEIGYVVIERDGEQLIICGDDDGMYLGKLVKGSWSIKIN